MSNDPASSQPSLEQAFIATLARLDAGGRARLKRNAGNALNEARNIYDVFFAALPYGVIGQRQQEDFFLVATLFALGTHRTDRPVANPPRNLGASLQRERDARGADKAGSLDKRFNALLDADREQLPFRLRQIVSLLASRKIPIDWAQLLRDLGWWSHPDRFIQRRWAEAYYRRSLLPAGSED
jgi:CRISPR system Cascade subunit CasB